MTRQTIKLDKETKDLLTDQEKIKLLTQHEGWPIVRNIFMKKITEFLNISDMDPKTPLGGSIIAEIGIRQGASTKLIEILNDIQGTADQFDANAALTQDINETYIIRPEARERV